MKTYYLFVATAIALTILIIGIPQLTGKAYVNNDKEKTPSDWLSKFILSYKSERESLNFEIPKGIRIIKVQSEHRPSSDYTERIYINSSKRTNKISYLENLDFKIKEDTLLILNPQDFFAYLDITIDTTVTQFIFDNINRAEVHLNQTSPLDFEIDNDADITLIGNRNLHLDRINVKNNSIFRLNTCFTPVINMQIENSMVYIDPLNNIDSLNAHLVGKSNIKIANTHTNADNRFEHIKQDLHISKTQLNIYPTGDTKYYDQMKKRINK